MNKKGFTLIELLVVIAIIGLLSTLAVFSLNSARTKARDAKRMSDMKMLSTAMEMYATDAGSYTGALTGCAAGSGLSDCATIQYGGESLLDLSTLVDPAEDTTKCNSGSSASCNYVVAVKGATEYEVCFYLEKGAGNLETGVFNLSEGGAMTSGCSL